MNRALSIFISVIYYGLIILIALSESGDILWSDACSFYKLSVTTYYTSIGSWTLMAFLGYLYVKIKKIKDLPLRFYFLLPLISLLYTVPSYSRNLNSLIESKPHKIKPAIIYDQSEFKHSDSCSFEFEFNGDMTKSIKVTRRRLKNLNIGDTILIKVADDCKYMNKIYDLFPSQPGFQQ
ncbi:hypothetical protein B0O79_1677 [Flavobacteriaceae bacterium MAR_2009_75]|nr:hypothetical protein B0O79_1677 [Flavobacteriaceae bacterium MAR_2009_75]